MTAHYPQGNLKQNQTATINLTKSEIGLMIEALRCLKNQITAKDQLDDINKQIEVLRDIYENYLL